MVATEQAAEVPTVDFGPFMRDEGVVIGEEPTQAQLEVARKIDESCRGSAFLHLTNFGVSPDLQGAAFRESAALFAMEDKEEKLTRIHPSTNTGYSPFLSENINRARKDPERKEAFNVRFPPHHRNNLSGCPPGFESMAERLREAFKIASRRYGMACALALGLPPPFFSQSLQNMSLCTIRFLHYPPYEEYDPDEEPPARIGEHTDFGIYTFLLLGENGAEGLQIKPVLGGDTKETGDDGWLNVQVPETPAGSAVGAIVNTGALMARWTNDEWRATAHRVLIQNKVQASRSRYSIALFVDPDSDYLVAVHDRFTKGGTVAKRYEPIKSSDYLLMKLQSMMGKS